MTRAGRGKGKGTPKKPPPSELRSAGPAEMRTSALLGAAAGLAAGFVVWAAMIRLEATPYHFGYVGELAIPVDRATDRAAAQWLAAVATGAVLGAIAGAMASQARRFLSGCATGALGLYLFALRGLWGYAGMPADASGQFPKGTVVEPLPAISWLAPAILAAGVSAILFARQLRRQNAAPSASDAAVATTTHLLLCFAAAHLTLQLALWSSAMEEFLHALPDFAALLPGG